MSESNDLVMRPTVGRYQWKKVALLCGGSFNPPHYFHPRMFYLARDYLESQCGCQVTEGIISPVADAYKTIKPVLVKAQHRINMVQLALESSDWIRVDSWESQNSDWLRTIYVLEHFSTTFSPNGSPPAKIAKSNDDQSTVNKDDSSTPHLMLLCGSDIIKSFAVPDLWQPQHIESIVRDYGLIVVSRAGSDIESFIRESDILDKYKYNIHIIFDWTNPNEISSSKIRTALRRKESVKYLVDGKVLEYIRTNHLYEAENESSEPSQLEVEIVENEEINNEPELQVSVVAEEPIWNAQETDGQTVNGTVQEETSSISGHEESSVENDSPPRATIRGRDIAAYLSPYEDDENNGKRTIKHRSVSSEFRPPKKTQTVRILDDINLERNTTIVSVTASAENISNLQKITPLSVSNPCVLNNVSMKFKGFKLSPTPETTV